MTIPDTRPEASEPDDVIPASVPDAAARRRSAANDPMLVLLRAAIAGDQDAWRRLYVENEGLMRRLLDNKITPDLRRRIDTEDLMQSAFLELSQHGGGLDLANARSFRAWLVTVLMNKLRDRIRKLERELETRAATGFIDQHPDLRPSLGEISEKAAEMARMYERILTLQPDDRDIVVFRSLDCLGWDEIARRTGIPSTTVRRRHGQLIDGLVRGFF